MSKVRVVRVLEYNYVSEEAYKEDFAHWKVPGTGVMAIDGNTVSSAIITVPDPDRLDDGGLEPVARLRADMSHLETLVFELSQKRKPEMRVIPAFAGEQLRYFIERVVSYPVAFRPFTATHNDREVTVSATSTVWTVSADFSEEL